MSLDDFLKKNNRKRVCVRGDGNCQFHAMSLSLNPNLMLNEDFYKMAIKTRMDIGLYLWEKRSKFRPFFSPSKKCKNFKSFCLQVATNKSNRLGDNLTVKAFAEMNNVIVRIFHYTQSVVTVDSGDDQLSTIQETSNINDFEYMSTEQKTIEICYTGNHYDSVEMIKN